jgi:hypothetical protein
MQIRPDAKGEGNEVTDSTQVAVLLTREQILAADDRQYEIVDVPEWGGVVKVATMSGHARDAYDARIRAMQADGADIETLTRSVRASLVSMCLVDASGQPMFTPQDMELLGSKSNVALTRVFLVAARLNQPGASNNGAKG